MKNYSQINSVEREFITEKGKTEPISAYFGEDTFNFKVMKQKLPKDVYKRLIEIIEKDITLDLHTANSIAHAMKEWALEKGATHFAHWFQPMTGATAEKHDAFIEHSGLGEVIERFSGKQLVQGEPDASSFPSGGIRATFEARGYTAWDMSSPAFIRHNGLGTTLNIPTVFISYTGEALDKKTPLLRSIRAVNKSSLRVLGLLGNKTSKKVVSNLGAEQEYFLIDKDYYYKRQDLVLANRTLVGAPPAKGQELDDQYFGSIRERVQSFMHDAEEQLFKLGIPAKTRHNEVAPSQFEIAPIFEEANVAVDHNQLAMDTFSSVARKHNLACLFHEKPFARINGSGKHVNWSLSDTDGKNLFEPGKNPEENLQFLIFLTATIKAVHKHGALLRASVATSGNDHRLGANEAPPAIISIFLGEQLSGILEDIENGKALTAEDGKTIDLKLSSLPVVLKDATDRNRTSPFAFTGNKFELRAVGSSQSISFPATVLNSIMAESLDDLSDKLEAKKPTKENLKKVVFELIQEEIKEHKAVVFAGDNYSEEWHTEAKKRGLPNLKTTPKALEAMLYENTVKLFSNYKILSETELKSRYNIKLEKYATDLEIETRTIYDIVSSGVLPAGLKFQEQIAASISKTAEAMPELDLSIQKELLTNVNNLVSKIYKSLTEMKAAYDKGAAIEDEQKKADFFCDEVKVKIESVRKYSDVLETLVDDDIWPFPKFWEMLFIS